MSILSSKQIAGIATDLQTIGTAVQGANTTAGGGGPGGEDILGSGFSLDQITTTLGALGKIFGSQSQSTAPAGSGATSPVSQAVPIHSQSIPTVWLIGGGLFAGLILVLALRR